MEKVSRNMTTSSIGLNSRLDTIQAAILIEKLKLFPEELKLRTEVAKIYSSQLSELCKVPTLFQVIQAPGLSTPLN